MHVFHRVLQLLHKVKQLLSCLAALYVWARAKHFGCHSVYQCSMMILVVSMFPIATLCYYYRWRDHAPQVSHSAVALMQEVQLNL